MSSDGPTNLASDIETGDFPAATVAEKVRALPAPEGAEIVAGLTPEQAVAVIGQLPATTAGAIVADLPVELAARIVEALAPADAARLLHDIDPDDRVDILALVAEPRRAVVVAALDEATRREVLQLQQFPPDSAGGIMTTQVTALYEHLHVEEAIQLLRQMSRELEQLFYTYVIDRAGKLVGVLSMRDMILAEPSDRLGDIMIRGVVSVGARTDQEEVARIVRKSDLLAIPVVDDERRLIGVITADDIADVMAEEANEDVLRLFGAGVEERLTSPWRLSYQKRIGWLMVNLLTAFAGAAVISRFEGTIASLALLAAFMPVVSAVGGNASVQAMAVTVRGMTEQNIDRRLLRQVLKRELFVGIAGGLTMAALMFLTTLAFSYASLGGTGALQLGLVVGASLAANLLLGCLVGTAVPVLMKRLGFDPAQSATIFTTAATDAVGFFLLLGLASWLLM